MLTYGDRAFSWNTGRHLESITDGENEYTYTYDENGIRTSKTVNGLTTYYNTMDGVILSQTDGTNTMHFQYDPDGVPLGLNYNGKQYLYMTNQQGDVASIVNSGGKEVVQYEYDEWGNTVVVTLLNNTDEERELAEANPLRYRGYYLDSETGYYYLQSRYYDPSICRFINADIPNIAQQYKFDVNGLNIFAYCCNNPINDVDYDGYYSASKAKAYAEKWWNRKNGINPKYGQNSSGDCTNFVSACLYAGGLSKMTGYGRSGWHCVCRNTRDAYNRRTVYYDRSHAWAAAQNLYDWLRDKHYINTIYTIRRKSDVDWVGKQIYKKPYCCAVLFFDWNNPKEPKGINHAALSGQIINSTKYYDMYYYAHTSDKNGKRYLNGKRQYTSIKDVYNNNYYKNMIVKVCVLR